MADDVHQTMVTETKQSSFWKPRHAIYAAGALLFVIVLVRACSGESEVEKLEAKMEKAEPVPAVVVEVPSPQQWPGQYPPAQQQPVYRYAEPRQPPAQQPRQLPKSDPGNPWSVQRQQPATEGYAAPSYPQRYEQQQAAPWGQTQPQRPTYSQPPGSAQYRPLDEQPRQQSRSVQPVPVAPAAGWPHAAPYDKPAGSSYGPNGGPQQYPYPGGYPGGYYGGSVYGVPGGYGGRLPGYPGYTPLRY